MSTYESLKSVVYTRVTHYVLQSGFSTTLTTSLSTLVFRRNPPQPVHIRPSSQTSCLWHQTTLTWVCPKWRPRWLLGHHRRCETAFPSAAIWRKGTKTSHRWLSQVNRVGGWPDEHHWQLQSLELQLLCLRWHCHDGAVHPFGDAVYTMPGRFKAQWLTYQSAITVFLSSGGMVATWSILQRNTLPFIFKHFCFFWISQVGSHLERPTPPTVASFRGRIGIPRFCILLRWPKREETLLSQFFVACGCTSPPYSTSALHTVMKHPTGTTFPYDMAVVKNASETSPWNLHDILHFSVCHFWVLLN